MIVQPVPVGPPSRSRRILRLAAATVPMVLLAGVVGAGVLGPRSEPIAPDASVSPAVEAAVQSTTPAAPPSRDPLPARRPPAYPASVAGIPVRTVDEALAARAAGTVGDLVAIAGFLGIRELPETCHDPRLGPYGAFCTRTGLLADAPWAADTGFAELGTHLHPQFPVGVRVPYRAAEVARSGAAASAAVVIARFDDPRARSCLPVGRHCGEELVVERVAWIEGGSYPRTITVDPDLDPAPGASASLRHSAAAASALLPDGAVPLLTALVRPGTITYIDPAMAPVVAGLEQRAVWYVRGIDAAAEPAGISWVIADAAGEPILSGILPFEGG